MKGRGKTEVDKRLARIEGQVRGLRSMLEDDREATEILTLVGAVRSALDGVAVTVLSYHVEECLMRAARGEEPMEAFASAREAVARCRG